MNVYAKSALLGATTGLRGTAGPFAARWSETGSVPMRSALTLSGEMVADKMPFVGNRTRPRSLLIRSAAAIYAVKLSSKRANFGAFALAAATAIGVSFLAERTRMALAERLKIPQQVIGIAEDALVAGLAFAVSRWAKPED